MWSTVLSLLMLGPALGPGYVLSYDMVWVPDLTLRQDFLGVGSALPRAVPSDAVVAVLDQLVPGMLLQKLVLLGSLVLAGAGAWILALSLARGAVGDGAPVLGALGGCAAATAYVWNPFVAERLVLGHWPLLLGYALQPWVALLARRSQTDGRLPVALLGVLPVASLSAGAGLATALVALAFGAGRNPRATVMLSAALLAANAPWLVSGVLHLGSARSDPLGAELFGGRGEGSLPAPLTFLGLGGIWNSEVVPVTRSGPLAIVWLVLLLALSLLAARRWWRLTARRDRAALLGLWLVGWGTAVLGWAAPSALAWVAAEIPGGGLLRDSTRLLGLCALLLATLLAHGVEEVRRLVSGPAGLVTAGALVLVPIAVMPDAAWGVSGRLGATSFPGSYAVVREAVGSGEGDLVVLPFTSYRAPQWNDGRKVLDPVGRAQRRDYVSSDELFVSGVRLAGEDPRARAAGAALELPTPAARTAGLRALGIELAVTDSSAAGPVVSLVGDPVVQSGTLTVIRLGDVEPRRVPAAWWLAMALAWAGWLLPGPVVAGLRRRAAR